MARPQAQFTKIVANQKQVVLHWSSRKNGADKVEEITSHELHCQSKPRPSFEAALGAFRPFMLEILGAPGGWADSTTVTGVSLNKEEDGRRGVVISAVRKCPFGAAPIALNTPHLRESLDDTKETGVNFLLPGMADAIDRMCEEAQAYLDGDRAQGELFGNEEPKAKGGRRSNEPELVGSIVGGKKS